MILLIMAWRNIWRNKMRSTIIMLSVSVGLFCGLIVLGIYKGMMDGRVKTIIESETGNIQIHDKQFKADYDPLFILANKDSIVKQIKMDPSVKAIAERSIVQGMLSSTTGSSGVQINGVDWISEVIISGINEKILNDDLFKWDKQSGILIGKKLAVKLNLKKGSKLVLTFTDTISELISSAYKVVGIYETDNAPRDEWNVYIKRRELNELLGMGNVAHELVIRLNDDSQTDSIQSNIKKRFPQYNIESWKDLSPETELMINTIDIYAYIIIGIIMLALSFGIVNTMLMAVLERTKEIGMIMALGLNKIKLFNLIFLETIFLTMAGVPVGILVAYTLTNYYHQKGMDWSDMGKEMMSSFGFSTTIYPDFPMDRLIPVLLIVVCTALLSCLFPAMRALRLNPVDALRK